MDNGRLARLWTGLFGGKAVIESATFHVISTELVVGSFALAGLCFVLHSFVSMRKSKTQIRFVLDATAHVALLFGFLALPFAILSGMAASPSGTHTSPLLVNKMLLSTGGGGLALGVLYARWKMYDDGSSMHLHNAFGALSTACMLLTASLGGTYSRGDSFTESLTYVKTNTLLMPTWMSIAVIAIILAALLFRRFSTVKHG